jgi:hypothetical protein
MKILYITAFLTLLCLELFAQQPAELKANQDTVTKKVAATKTNSNWDIIADFYQISVNDVTGNSKGLTFGATLYAISSGFKKPKPTDPPPSYFVNNFQPVLTVGYKNNFQNLNSSLGFKYAIFNQTDAKHSWLLNHNQPLLNTMAELQAYGEKFLAALRADHKRQLEDPKIRATLIAGLDSNSQAAKNILKDYREQLSKKLQSQIAQITAIEKTGDASKMSPELVAEFDKIDGVHTVSGLAAKEKAIKAQLADISNQIANGWNIAINPMATYDLTHGGFQGVNLGVTGSKGFNLFKEDKYHTSQLVGKFNYVTGTDTIVSKINTSRKQITDQFGFNQVIGTSTNKSVSKSDPTPSVEASLTGSYNYVFSGLKPKEKNAQPALNLKFGVLVGKSTWLTLPLSYNFGTKAGTALVSVQANIGTGPF